MLATFTPIAPPETRNSLPRSWTRELCASINIQNEKIEALTKLLIHSVAQNNAYASLNGVITDKMEQRLQSMEKTISAISQRQDGPSTNAPARHNVEKDLLNNIARKITSIEHNTRNPTVMDGNPPVVPKTIPQVPNPVQPTNTKPANWVPSLVNESSFGILAGWAAMITQGRWGSRTKEGKLEGVNFLNLNAKSRGGVAEFIKRSAHFQFSRNGSGGFILPPHTPLTFKLGWSSSVTWTVVDANKVTKSSRKNTIFADNMSTSDKVHISLGAASNTDVPPVAANTPPVAPSHTPASSPEVFYDDLWTPTPPSGKTKSFAEAAKKPTTNASKGKNPQPLYNGIPVSQFMQRAERNTNGYRRGFGKRYMIKFHRTDKPSTGTRMLEQAVTGEINRTCGALFHIKASAAEWTSAQNLNIFFTHDSVDAQIVKAGQTILGTVAKGFKGAIFLKSVKWSRIVVRNVPLYKWVPGVMSHNEDNTNSISGDLQPVTDAELTDALRDAHPILKDAVFTEGPNWTNRDPFSNNPPPNGRANVSFTLPDPDESRIKELSRQPLILFDTACWSNQWTEKINLIQCPRCWKYGDKIHPSCPIRCAFCGGPHGDNVHHMECRKCVNSDINQADRIAGKTKCPHPHVCPNCKGEHAADSTECKMRNHAVCEARKNGNIGRNQKFITDYASSLHHDSPRPTLRPKVTDTDGGLVPFTAEEEMSIIDSYNFTGTGMTFEQQQNQDELTFGKVGQSSKDTL